ncbi:asparaginase [Rhodoferax sp. GW822-FHT02A01]|uniref:asparaginase n=1 Tax=Rhodoferax sp. GW822-FHT02A01 TaxID=3141537 RepID=UPI00315C86A9
MAKKVVFLGMGGTIAGKAQNAGDNVGYTAGQVGVQQLLQSVPGLDKAVGDDLPVSEQVCQIDSKDLEHCDWFTLTARVLHHLQMPDVRAVVITHGTDTLEETAYWLSRALPGKMLNQKPVVLTCAMRPASSLAPDGPTNMADAATVACFQGARGLLVVCAGKIFEAAHVQKVHPYRVDAFDAGEAGPLGVVEEGSVRLLFNWPNADALRPGLDCAQLQARGLPRVEVLLNHAGASGAIVRSLLNPVEGDAPVRGIVVAGTGNGTIHKDLEAALQLAQRQGVRVVRVSRCAYGCVVGSAAADGAFAHYGLSAVKARIALMLDLVEAT